MFSYLLPFIILPFANHRGLTSAHIMPILIPDVVDRIWVLESLKQQGIQASHHYPPIHRFSAYQFAITTKPPCLPITENIAEREITLPLYPTMGDENVHAVVRAVQVALGAG